jgi:prephenate dehydrogenase
MRLSFRRARVLNASVLWEKVTLIGVGLLGGSLGLALRERNLARNVTGYVRRQIAIDECVRSGAVDTATRNLLEAVTGADLIVFCTPLGQMKTLAEEILPALRKDALITDVGSVKATVTKDLEPIFKKAGAHFVGSHPMAGSEKTGVLAARADLFHNAICIVTAARTSTWARRVEELWISVGGRPLRLTAAQHDEFVSRSSHLPHVVAAELANYVLSPAHPPQQAQVCASGFRDTTRIAAGSPEMWRDIALANRANLSRVLGVFIDDLREFQHCLDSGNAAAIEEFFRHAKERRDAWQAPATAPSPE